MKIRTKEEFQDAVDQETSWRKKELTAINVNIVAARKFTKDTALRSGIALLYAHWEGLIKNLASYYLSYVSFQNLTFSELKPNFLAISIKEDLKTFDSSNKASIHNQIVISIKKKGTEKAQIPYENVIKTNSNLKSDIFVEIMETLGLDYSQYKPDFNMLDEVLLKMRNEIAHGERLESISLDEKRFEEIYSVMSELMNKFVAQITNAVYLEEYRIK